MSRSWLAVLLPLSLEPVPNIHHHRPALSSPINHYLSHVAMTKNEYAAGTLSGQHTPYSLAVLTQSLPSIWFGRKWQRYLHCRRFAAISINDCSQLVEGSFRPQPQRRETRNFVLGVYFLAPRSHCIIAFHMASPTQREERKMRHGTVDQCSPYAKRGPTNGVS